MWPFRKKDNKKSTPARSSSGTYRNDDTYYGLNHSHDYSSSHSSGYDGGSSDCGGGGDGGGGCGGD